MTHHPFRTACLAVLAVSVLLASVPRDAAAVANAIPPELPAADPTLPSARTLLDECVADLGGAAKLALIQSYRVEARAELSIPGNELVPARVLKASGEVVWRRDGHARARSTCDTLDTFAGPPWARKLEFGVKPGFGWSRVPDPERELFGRLPGGQDLTEAADPLRILYDGIARHNETILEPRTVRRAQKHGKDCYQVMARIRYTPAASARTIGLWLDVSQKRLVAVSELARIQFADWRDVGSGPDDPLGGVIAPFKFTPGMMCGDKGNSFRVLAEVVAIRFNDVTAEEIAPPAGLRDMGEVMAEVMAEVTAGESAGQPQPPH